MSIPALEWNLKTPAQTLSNHKIYGKRGENYSNKKESTDMFVQEGPTEKSSVGKQKEQSNKLNKGQQRRASRRVSSKWIARPKAILSPYRVYFPSPLLVSLFCSGCTKVGKIRGPRTQLSESRTQLCTCSTHAARRRDDHQSPQPSRETQTIRNSPEKSKWDLWYGEIRIEP